MAKGFGLASKVSAENASKGGNSLWGGKLVFKLPDDGDTAIMRFIPCDDEGNYAASARHHEVPVEGRNWPDLVPCIAQDEDGEMTNDPCPGCEHDLPLKFKGYILGIWRDGPVYKKNEKGRLVKDNSGAYVVQGEKDQIAIWSSGPRLFDELGETDENYGDLGNRDFKIKRKGKGTDTTYTIVPYPVDGGKAPLSKADKKLISENEIDLADFIRPPSYDKFEKMLDGDYSSDDDSKGGSSNPVEQSRKTNPFKRN